MDRRQIIKTLLALSIPINLKGNDKNYYYDENPNSHKNIFLNRIFPKGLKQGSKIGITAPASPSSPYEMREILKFIESQGMEYEIGETIQNKTGAYRYLSDNDDKRANELMEFFERKDIDCILCARGGYGVMRILDLLDYEKIKMNPKAIIGFSDITALLNAIYAKTKLITYHGPVASSSLNTLTIDSLKKTLISSYSDEKIEYSDNDSIELISGEANGFLVGGNLRMLVSTLGTPYESYFHDKSILFLEDVAEAPYQVDRMLTQLKLSGKLSKCKGIIIGKFENLNKRTQFFPTLSFTIKEIFEQHLQPLGIPTLLDFPFGHVKDKITLPIGIQAHLNTNQKKLTILERPISL